MHVKQSSAIDKNRSFEETPRAHWLMIGLWSLVVYGATQLFWKVVQYWHQLLHQPRLRDLSVAGDGASHFSVHASVHEQAAGIAAANMRASIEPRTLPDGRQKLVLCAGMRNFREPWARDLGFASLGLLELGEYQAVRESLEVFFINQRPSGQFPVKVHSTNVLDRYMHSLFKREQPIVAPLRPKYVTAHNTVSLDGNALLVIAALNYAKKSGDDDFAAKHWPNLKRGVLWLEEHALEDDGLLHQAPFADWADSVARQGRVLYANVLYWKALADLAAAAPRYGTQADVAYFAGKAHQIKQSINRHFWRSDLGYYVTNEIFDNLSSCGNLLAVAWGLTTSQQAHAILDAMHEFKMADPVPTQSTHRAYPRKFIALENRLGGIPHYHTSAAWLWLGAWHVIALARMERLDEATTLLDRIAHVIVRDGAVHEVYAPDGHYLSTFWYTSEAPLTWSAGMVTHAYHVYQRHLQQGDIIGLSGIRASSMTD